MESLVNDSRFFPHVPPRNITSTSRVKSKSSSYVKAVVSSILGSDFQFNSSNVDDYEITDLAIYDELSKLLPFRSSQSMFFWRKLARPFASMLDTAAFPISTQITFLTFVYARVLGMMGPLDSKGPASYMTFDGSPVELSWVIPSNVKPGDGNAGRQVRFAIEPIDPRSGRLLRGMEVLRYLTSPKGSLGIVKCDRGVLDWSMITEQFLYSGAAAESDKRFFVGFDFSRSGDIVLKTYYIPRGRPSCIQSPSQHDSQLSLWDVDYTPLRSLLTTLDSSLMKSLNMMISYAENADAPFKPRLEILSMDCVSNEANRLKMYCRPSRGTSWADARYSFTLGGRLDSPRMDRVLARLEILWNLLFPFAHSSNNHDLNEGLKIRHADHEDTCNRRSADHPTGGLLYYYSLVPGSDMILPKIYLPVSRYCANDLVIAEALEKFHAIDGRGLQDHGWVAREVSSA
ncbi:hypothetical protein H0H87_010543 [Tephrocybe sp. NHM501043]|nr:hypothetical protein H0H87_010543 [Tephrocybe sp. NHM501043]